MEDLRTEISQIFALIIRRGFNVRLNDKPVTPESFDLLTTTDLEDNESGIDTYKYKSRINDVAINIAIGFYRPLASVDEIERENKQSRSSSNAGITVICNDRIVLFRDKGRVAGWGNKPVPAFHNQFICIAGIVRFTSKESLNLPLTTTKRGLDLSSPVYWYALEYMKEGLKKFTDFTNQWKGREKEKEVSKIFEKAVYKDSLEIIKSTEEEKWRKVPKAKYDDVRINPPLPKPENRNTKARITYFKEKEDVSLVAEYLFGDSSANPSDVGSRCFDLKLEQIRGDLI